MKTDEQTGQGGFTIIEVSIASLITLIGLVALAGLFTLSITQNKVVKQFTSTTAFAQEKLEQLTALETSDPRLTVGGSLTAVTIVPVVGFTTPTIQYADDIYVSDDTKDADAGTVYINAAIPAGRPILYRRYWSVQAIPTLPNSMLIGVRVMALQSARNRNGFATTDAAGGGTEQTTLTIVRSW